MPKILIADDESTNVLYLGELLKRDYEVFVAKDGKTALELAASVIPDLVLMDVMMPGIDGYQACIELKRNPLTADIPVIFITARSDADDVVRGFDAGGEDYITKPFNPQELHARVRTHLELKQARERLEEMNRRLASALEQMETMARVDPLTGLANRRYLLDRLQQETARSLRHGTGLSVAMVDIDDFKMINDTHGHVCGDLVLKQTAAIITESMRKEDMASRWGGEEFLLVFPETPLPGAAVIAEKIRAAVEASEVRYDGMALTITITVGVAQYRHEAGIDENIRRADDAMYRGKRENKNRVILAE
ncbi:MAG: diguanylate cyclase [Spirochaetes bacterium]|nr:diguanylate cyclase [Spirochaetota bacterium]